MPDFALDLDHSGIRLLRREGHDWTELGSVALDARNLPAKLKNLRQTAELLAEGPLETELIIPPSQILYTVLPPATDGRFPEDPEIAKALDGLTPCPVDEMVFDWRAIADGIAVAALDITTLDEAEEFAVTYGFNPVRFSARPTLAEFPDIPDFGQTQFARDHSAAMPPPVFTSRRAEDPPVADILALPGTEVPEDVDNLFVETWTDVTEGPPPLHPPAAALGMSVDKPPLAEPILQRSSLNNPESAAAEALTLGPTAPNERLRAAPKPASIPSNRGADWKPVAITAALAAVFLGGLVATAFYLVSPDPLEDEQAAVIPDANNEPAPVTRTTTVPSDDAVRPVPRLTPQMRSDPAARIVLDSPAARLLPDLPTPAPVSLDSPLSRDTMSARALASKSLPGELGRDSVVIPPGELDSADIWQTPPPPPPDPVGGSLDRLYIASIDPVVIMNDPVALSPVIVDIRPPSAPFPLPAVGQSFDLDGNGLVIATPEGSLTPDGIVVGLGVPPVVPPPRPTNPEPAVDGSAATIAFVAIAPRGRPPGLVENNERSRFGGRTQSELAGLRPRPRPEVEEPAALADAEAEQILRVVSRAIVPPPRPDDFARQVQAAIASAQETSRPSRTTVRTAAVSAPPASQPRIPSSASVARQATIPNAINLRRFNLIGVYGSDSDRRALIRLPSGRYVKVEVGDRIDGGRVASIGNGELRYVKGGRNVTLKVPSG